MSQKAKLIMKYEFFRLRNRGDNEYAVRTREFPMMLAHMMSKRKVESKISSYVAREKSHWYLVGNSPPVD